MRALIGRAIRWFLDGVPARRVALGLSQEDRAAVNAKLSAIAAMGPEAIIPIRRSEDDIGARIRTAVQVAADAAAARLRAQIDRSRPRSATWTAEEQADWTVSSLRSMTWGPRGEPLPEEWIEQYRLRLIESLVAAGWPRSRGLAP